MPSLQNDMNALDALLSVDMPENEWVSPKIKRKVAPNSAESATPRNPATHVTPAMWEEAQKELAELRKWKADVKQMIMK